MLELVLQVVGAGVAVIALWLEITEPSPKKRRVARAAMLLVLFGAGLGVKARYEEERSKREFALLYANDAVARQQDVEDTRTQLWELLDSNKNIPDRLKPMLEVVATFIVSEGKKDLRRATETLKEHVNESGRTLTKKVDERLATSSTAMTKTVDDKLAASSTAMTKTVDDKLAASSTAMTKSVDDKLAASSTAMTKAVDDKLAASSTAMTKAVDDKLAASSTAMTKTVDDKLAESSTAMTKTVDDKLAAATKASEDKLAESSTAMTKTVDDKLAAATKASEDKLAALQQQLENLHAKFVELEQAHAPKRTAAASGVAALDGGVAVENSDVTPVVSLQHAVVKAEEAQPAK